MKCLASILQLLLLLMFIRKNATHPELYDLKDILRATATYEHYRLPTSVRPEKYHLAVVTHLENPENLSFTGEVTIQLNIVHDTNNITLHARNLTIDESKIVLKSLTHRDDRKNCIKSTSVNSDHDYFTIRLCEIARHGEKYLLTMPFKAPLGHNLHGYYKSSYVDKKRNITRWLATTQFEPASARAAFPCFDEPEYKAVFTVVLGHQKQYTAISNMPVKEVRSMSERADWVWTEFEQSVPMSTYLVAYTVNDFAYVPSETTTRHKVQFRTWARRDALEQCHFAAKVGPKVLHFYEELFNIDFPLPKIDQIAIPDFSAGAMENWGLVTYRETALLYASNISSASSKQRVASVIAHELAHQWFGNLVTMKWWTDLWLNEGFATYIASLGVEYIRPEWKSLEEESVDNIMTIFKVDSLKSSHPISQPIQNTNEISQIFDSISYKKGSTVLRMMHNFLGDMAFRSGVQHYLETHAYGNAEQDNLWSALTESAHHHRSLPAQYNIKQIMDSWTLQTGYPVLIVTRDYDSRLAEISQIRFLLDTQASRSEDQNCWWVPLSYTTQGYANFSKTEPKAWLECGTRDGTPVKVLKDMPPKDEWIIFNIQMTTLYKVKYDEHNWNLLIETLMSDNFHQIHVINRAQLIDDALTLAWSGDQNYDIAMRLIEYLVREKAYIPWKAAMDNLANVNRILRQTPEYEFFKKYMRKILKPIYLYLGGLNADYMMDASHSSILHKALIAGWACRFEVEDCVPRAREYFNEWRHVPDPEEMNPIPTDLRSVVYCTAMRHGNDDDWQFLWNRYKKSNVASERRVIISALGCTREVWLLQRYLLWAFDATSHIRKQDSSLAFGSVARGEVGYHIAKDYFIENIKSIHSFFGPETTDIARMISPLALQMTSSREYETMQKFAAQHKDILAKSKQSVNRALETILINKQWKEQNYEQITKNLKQRF